MEPSRPLVNNLHFRFVVTNFIVVLNVAELDSFLSENFMICLNHSFVRIRFQTTPREVLLERCVFIGDLLLLWDYSKWQLLLFFSSSFKWYNKWTVVRGRTKRKMFQLFRHHGVVDQSWLSEDRAACIAARFFLRDQEVTPTDAELKRVRQMLASYLDPEQQRHVTRTLKDGSPRASGVPSDV